MYLPFFVSNFDYARLIRICQRFMSIKYEMRQKGPPITGDPNLTAYIWFYILIVIVNVAPGDST